MNIYNRFLTNLLIIFLIITSCSPNKTSLDNIDSTISKYLISEAKKDEVKATLSNYIHHSRMSEDDIDEFIYNLCDTSNRIYHPVFFIYDTKIEGFNVEGVLYIGSDGSTDYRSNSSVYADLYFSSDSLTFDIHHHTFRPSIVEFPDTLKACDCITLSYIEPIFPDLNHITLDSIRNLPFAFVDIDFDGKKDLLLAHPCNGQKSISTYTAFSLPTLNDIDPFKGFTWNCLDEWTEFDYKTQTVISLLWAGYDGSVKLYFRYEGDKLKPYLKEEYTQYFDILKSSTLIHEHQKLE